jgi:Fur family ferric uptake transcriptional regulator
MSRTPMKPRPRKAAGDADPRPAAFRAYLMRSGLKATRQRDAIARAFLASGRHLTVWQLHQEVIQQDPRVNVATVFRTLKVLCRAGLAVERRFAHSLTRYEAAAPSPHHHLICSQCGHIEEFEHDGLERIQAAVARRAGFAVTDARVELYGACRACREAGRPAAGRRHPGARRP